MWLVRYDTGVSDKRTYYFHDKYYIYMHKPQLSGFPTMQYMQIAIFEGKETKADQTTMDRQ